MGSLCGGNTQTSTSQSTTTPTNVAGLQSIYDKVQSAASTPYTPYGGQLTAGINEQQNLGIAGINAGANTASPYYAQAQQYATQAGAPISSSAIQGYMNPYTQSVIDATQRNFGESNAQQQQQVKGNLALSGALGGSRQAVAQAETARQQKLAQDPVIAQLNAQNYQQALAAAQGDRSAAGTAAGTLGQLGTGAQGAALQGAGAQIGAGTLQQQTQQADLNAQYQQYLQAQGFPYQQAQFLAQYGTPAALAQGSTTSGTGTQTSPGPNQFAQLAGLGIAGAGLFLKDGGRVEYADGGSPFNFITDAPGYIPRGGNAPQVSMPQAAPAMSMSGSGSASQTNPWSAAISGMDNLRGVFAGDNSGTGGWGATSTGSEGVGGIGGLYSGGGLVEAIHGIHKAIKHSRGGAVGGTPFAAYASGGRGYADGGPTFDDRFSAAFSPPEPMPQEEPFRLAGPEAMDAWRRDVDTPNPALVADAGMPPAAPQPATGPANPMQSVALPPQITGPAPQEEPGSAMAYDAPAPRNPMVLAPQSAPAPEQPQQQFGKSLFGVNLSDKTRQAMVAAGLGIAASRSPFALTAIGEGGLKGLGAYSEATRAEQEAADKKISQAQQQRRVDMEAARIAQNAEQFAKTSSQAERRLKLQEDKTPEGFRVGKDGSYEPIPGYIETVRKVAEAKRVPGNPIDDETASFVAEQVLAGDSRALIGFGRGAQGAENLIKIRSLVAQKAREQGMDPTDILNKVAIQSGNTATQRTFGTQVARMAINATEAQGAIELGRTASAAVPRTNWVPVNKAIQAYQTGTSDPALAKFGAANLAIINTYARAISPTGQPTIHDKEHAERLLSTATGPKAYEAVLDQMNEEIKIAHAAPTKAKQEIEDIRKGRASDHGASAAPAAAIPATPPNGVPAGSAYSPSRKQWKAPDGTIYNADGSKA